MPEPKGSQSCRPEAEVRISTEETEARCHRVIRGCKLKMEPRIESQRESGAGAEQVIGGAGVGSDTMPEQDRDTAGTQSGSKLEQGLEAEGGKWSCRHGTH